jgi:hypothetical protein
MDRSNNTESAIYGYTVCLIAVLLFVAASVGLVNGVFRTMNPGFEGSHHRMSMPWSRTHGFQGTLPRVAQTGSAPGSLAQRRNTFRGAMIARARLNAVRGLGQPGVVDHLDRALQGALEMAKRPAGRLNGHPGG